MILIIRTTQFLHIYIKNYIFMKINFKSSDGDCEYVVPVIKIPELSTEEMVKRNMIILIPLQLMKLRYWVDKKPGRIEKVY